MTAHETTATAITSGRRPRRFTRRSLLACRATTVLKASRFAAFGVKRTTHARLAIPRLEHQRVGAAAHRLRGAAVAPGRTKTRCTWPVRALVLRLSNRGDGVCHLGRAHSGRGPRFAALGADG